MRIWAVAAKLAQRRTLDFRLNKWARGFSVSIVRCRSTRVKPRPHVSATQSGHILPGEEGINIDVAIPRVAIIDVYEGVRE